jgi:flagellar biosynthetic protein FliR
MLQLTDAQIGGWIGAFLFPLFRIGAMLMVMPLIGTQLVPTRVRLLLAAGMSVVVAPTLPPMPQVDALSLRALALIVEQILIGAMLGMVLQLFFQIFNLIGQIYAAQIGFGFAAMNDPVSGVQVPVLGQFLLMLTNLLFLAMNAHLVAFEILVDSFSTLPVGGGLSADHFSELAGKLGWVFGASLLLSLPAVTALLVVNIAFGVMTRAAPQLNIFSIGMPLTLTLGLVIIWLSMTDLLGQYQGLVTDALQMLRDFANGR